MMMDTINPTVEMLTDIQKDLSKVVPSATDVLSQVHSMSTDVLINSDYKHGWRKNWFCS